MEVRMNGYTPNDSLLRHWNVLWNELESRAQTGAGSGRDRRCGRLPFLFRDGRYQQPVGRCARRGRQPDRRSRAQAARVVEGCRSASGGACVRHDAARVHDARGRRPREYQGVVQGRRARSDGAEAAREQAIQDQSRGRKLANGLDTSRGQPGEFWLGRRRFETAGAVSGADEATTGRLPKGGIAKWYF